MKRRKKNIQEEGKYVKRPCSGGKQSNFKAIKLSIRTIKCLQSEWMPPKETLDFLTGI